MRSLLTSAAPSSTKTGSSTRFAITISAPINSSTSAQSNALQLEHLSFFLRCLRTRLRLLSCSTPSLSSSSELSSPLSPSPPECVGTVWKRFSPRTLPMVDQRLLARKPLLSPSQVRKQAAKRARLVSAEFPELQHPQIPPLSVP